MSIFKSIGNALGRVARVALPFIPGGGAILAAGETIRSAVRGATPPPPTIDYGGDARFYRSNAIPSAVSTVTRGISNMSMQGAMGVLPGIGALASAGRYVGTVAGRVTRRYGGAIGAAAGVGGLLYDAAGNPVRQRRRRSKGITARELKAFTRVTGIMNKYCKVGPPRRRAAAPKGKACR